MAEPDNTTSLHDLFAMAILRKPTLRDTDSFSTVPFKPLKVLSHAV